MDLSHFGFSLSHFLQKIFEQLLAQSQFLPWVTQKKVATQVETTKGTVKDLL